MKKLIVIALLTAACGYSSRDNELVGQVKKVKNVTPIICGDYRMANVSLGFIRDGVGTISNDSLDLLIQSDEQFKVLKEANENGKLVKIVYDRKRVAICTPEERILTVEIVTDPSAEAK